MFLHGDGGYQLTVGDPGVPRLPLFLPVLLLWPPPGFLCRGPLSAVSHPRAACVCVCVGRSGVGGDGVIVIITAIYRGPTMCWRWPAWLFCVSCCQ